MSRHTDRGGRKPYILKSFVTEAVKDLRKDEVVYVRTSDHVDAIKTYWNLMKRLQLHMMIVVIK